MTAGLGARRSALGTALLACAMTLAPRAGAQAPSRDTVQPSAERRAPTVVGFPVILDGDSLFSLYENTLAYSAAERAARVTKALSRIARTGLAPTDSIRVVNEAGRSEIRLGLQPLLFVTDLDASAAEMPRAIAAQRYADRIGEALPAAVVQRSTAALWRDAGEAAIQTLIAVLLILLTRFVFPRLYRWLDGRRAKLTDRISAFGIQGLTADRIVDALLVLARSLRVVVVLAVVAAYVPAVLSSFPQTAAFARTLIRSVVAPLRDAGGAVVDYLPDLVLTVVIIIGTRLVLRGVRGFFTACERGTIRIRTSTASGRSRRTSCCAP